MESPAPTTLASRIPALANLINPRSPPLSAAAPTTRPSRPPSSPQPISHLAHDRHSTLNLTSQPQSHSQSDAHSLPKSSHASSHPQSHAHTHAYPQPQPQPQSQSQSRSDLTSSFSSISPPPPPSVAAAAPNSASSSSTSLSAAAAAPRSASASESHRPGAHPHHHSYALSHTPSHPHAHSLARAASPLARILSPDLNRHPQAHPHPNSQTHAHTRIPHHHTLAKQFAQDSGPQRHRDRDRNTPYTLAYHHQDHHHRNLPPPPHLYSQQHFLPAHARQHHPPSFPRYPDHWPQQHHSAPTLLPPSPPPPPTPPPANPPAPPPPPPPDSGSPPPPTPPLPAAHPGPTLAHLPLPHHRTMPQPSSQLLTPSDEYNGNIHSRRVPHHLQFYHGQNNKAAALSHPHHIPDAAGNHYPLPPFHPNSHSHPHSHPLSHAHANSTHYNSRQFHPYPPPSTHLRPSSGHGAPQSKLLPPFHQSQHSPAPPPPRSHPNMIRPSPTGPPPVKFKENDRTYADTILGKTIFPCDEKEQERLDIYHNVFKIALNQNLHQAPIHDSARILDLGTGTGIWALEMGEQYPSAQISGIDLLDIQPETVCHPNVSFMTSCDLEDPQSFMGKQWDLIHLRLGCGSIRDWSRLYKTVFAHLIPGDGWFEHVEIDLKPRCNDGTLAPDSALTQWYDYLSDAIFRGDRKIEYPTNTRELLQHAGFTDIQEKVIRAPLNDWPVDPRESEVGRWYNLGLVQGCGIESLSLAPFARLFGWNADNDVRPFLDRVVQETMQSSIHAYHNIHVWTARRPVQ